MKPTLLKFCLASLTIITCLPTLFAQTDNYELTGVEPVAAIQSGTLLIDTEKFTFPDGKLKCLVMSFDDGPEHDRILVEKLNDANIVGTFHLNSGRLGEKADWLSKKLGYTVHFVSESELATLYSGHEVSGHTSNHPDLTALSDSLVEIEVLSDIEKLNSLIIGTKHEKVQGLAYPFGTYNESILDQLNTFGLKYARTVNSISNYELPSSNYLALKPTCHIFDALTYSRDFISFNTNEMILLNMWGHSYEFHNNWALADSICAILGNNPDIWYAKTIEIVDYLNAIKCLEYTNDSVFNPSSQISVWIKDALNESYELKPGHSMPIHIQTSFVKTNNTALYPPHTTVIKYHTQWTRNHYRERIAEFRNNPLQSGEIVFVGNSITEQGKNWGAKLEMENVRNRGISGDMTDGILERINEINYFKPEALFLLIGVNDLYNLHYQKEIPSPEYVASNIIKITEHIHEHSPETKIYVQTILPTSEDFMMENIIVVNRIIKQQVINGSYNLIDLNAEFVGENGLMQPKYTTDGTHLNEEGYRLWVKTIKPVLFSE